MRRLVRARIVLLSALVALVLSGCLNLTLDTTVSPQGRFTGEMSLLLDKQGIQALGVTSLQQIEDQFGEERADNPRVRVTWSETDTDYVETVSFTDATPQEIDEVATTSTSAANGAGSLATETSVSFPLTAEVHGETMVVTMTQGESSRGGSDLKLDREQQRVLQPLLQNSAFSLTITMPGDISSVTGAWRTAARKHPDVQITYVGPTLEIIAPLADVIEIADESSSGDTLEVTSAITADAPDGLPGGPDDGGSGGTGAAVPILIGGAVVLLVLVVVGLLLARRRADARSSGAEVSATGAGTPTEPPDPPTEPGSDPGPPSG